MMMYRLLRRDVFMKGTFRPTKLLLLSAIDVVSQFLCQFGLTVAGSSLYIIIYSSATIWIAIESRVLMHRRLSALQWLGCAVVVGGLAITGGDLAASLSQVLTLPVGTEELGLLGLLCVLNLHVLYVGLMMLAAPAGDSARSAERRLKERYYQAFVALKSHLSDHASGLRDQRGAMRP